MKKNSCAPINPKKIFMPWPKKNSYKEFDNEKKFPPLENAPQLCLGGKGCYPSNFLRSLQSLLLRYTAETNFYMLFQFQLNLFFQKRVFSCLQKVDHVPCNHRIKKAY